MPHIHTSPNQHDHTVTAYIIRDDQDEPRALLHMHKKLHKLLPVGGHIELDETPWAAMVHELEEEAGYTIDQLDVMQPSERIESYDDVVVHPQPILMNTHDITSHHYHSDTGYLLLVHNSPEQPPASGESSDLRWLTRKDVASLYGSEEVWNNTVSTYLAAFDIFLSNWQPIPATRFRIDKINRH